MDGRDSAHHPNVEREERSDAVGQYPVAERHAFYDLADILIQSEVDVNLCNHFDGLTVK
jgi:hypothetical protein